MKWRGSELNIVLGIPHTLKSWVRIPLRPPYLEVSIRIWDITPSSLVEVCRRCGGMYYFCRKGLRASLLAWPALRI
jgi:hypothetical protein